MSLEALETRLAAQLTFVREHVRNEADWATVLASYPSAPRGAGPTATQLRAVLNAIVIACATELERFSLEPISAARIAALWERLCRLVAEECRAHEPWLLPEKPRSRLLGNILANATASVNEEFWTRFKWDHSIVTLCRGCGAPQQAVRDFKCHYCGGSLFKQQEDGAGR